MKEYRFRGLRQQTTEEKEEIKRLQVLPETPQVHDGSLLDVIFAPDPISGNPRSDLFFDMNADPNVKDFIRRELQSVRLQMEKTENSDDALNFTKSMHETTENYLSRMKGYFKDPVE